MHKNCAPKATNTYTDTDCQSPFVGVVPGAGQSSLSADNPEASTWADYKHQADVVAWAYRSHEAPKVRRWAERITDCGRHLTYGYVPHPEGYRRELVTARLCRVRTCPICQWRRSLKLTAEVGERLHKICQPGNGMVAMMLTLTIRNCDVSDLRSTIKAMLRAWSKLTRRVIFAGVTHWARSVEVTRGRAYVAGDAHPHMHIMLVMPQAAATPDVLDTTRWAREWQDLLELDYLPVCDIRAINQTSKGGIREVLKYAVKPSAETAISGWLADVAIQLDGLRVFAASKSLKVSDELEDTVDDTADSGGTGHKLVASLPWVAGMPARKTCAIYCYRWDGATRHYWRTMVLWGQTPKEYRDAAIVAMRGGG